MSRRVAAAAGAALIVGMGALTACSTGSTKEEKAPATPAPAPGSSAPAAPSDKGMAPDAPNSFSPTVKAPPAHSKS